MGFTDLPTWMLNQAHQRGHGIVAAKLDAVGARGYDYRVLDVLADSATPLSQVAIGSLARLDRRDVTVTLAGLEEAGFVARTADPEDGRRNVVTLTASGRDRHRLLASLVADAQEELLEALDATAREAFLGALRLLAKPGRDAGGS